MHKLFGAAAALALLSAAAPAFSADNATADATANVITPISVSTTQPLVFGNILSTASGGTVSVAAGGARTGTAGLLLQGVTAQAAHFDVTADTTGSTNYTLTYLATDLTRNGGGGTAMTLTLNPSLAAGAYSAATQSINIGGNIAVGANQAPGQYTGSIKVSAAYN